MVIKKSKVCGPDICTGLLISLLLCLSACILKEDKSTNQSGITLLWEGKQAIGISIPYNLTADFPKDSLDDVLAVRLAGNEQEIRMLGKYQLLDNVIIFNPLIPFTQGFRYDIYLDTAFLESVVIPQPDYAERPVLLAIFPSADTLPENLLKMYFQFSSPMASANSLHYISLVDNHGDTLQAPFLALQPELWNKEGTRLTLWLDPGRIKKDLQPNQALGSPLRQGETITLIVSPAWKAQNGMALDKFYTKQFFVTTADRLPPTADTWSLKTPEAETRQPLEIRFGEPLDHALLQETITIRKSDNENVKGKIKIEDDERKLIFVPDRVWTYGNYQVWITAYLEDLAGNNLNRPFEVDNESHPPVHSQEFYQLEFEIR